jgi:hypothetical protein
LRRFALECLQQLMQPSESRCSFRGCVTSSVWRQEFMVSLCISFGIEVLFQCLDTIYSVNR